MKKNWILFAIIFILSFSALSWGASNPSIINSATGTGTTALSVSAPASVQAGDILVAYVEVYYASSQPTITNPSGWSTIGTDSVVGTYAVHRTAWHAWASGETTYAWTFSNGTRTSGGIIAVRYLNTAVPIDATTQATGTSGTRITTGAITTLVENSMLLLFSGDYYSSTRTFATETVNNGTTATEQYDIGTYCGNAGSYYLQAAIGSSGTCGATVSGTITSWAGRLLSLRPLNASNTSTYSVGSSTTSNLSNLVQYNSPYTYSVASSGTSNLFNTSQMGISNSYAVGSSGTSNLSYYVPYYFSSSYSVASSGTSNISSQYNTSDSNTYAIGTSGTSNLSNSAQYSYPSTYAVGTSGTSNLSSLLQSTNSPSYSVMASVTSPLPSDTETWSDDVDYDLYVETSDVYEYIDPPSGFDVVAQDTMPNSYTMGTGSALSGSNINQMSSSYIMGTGSALSNSNVSSDYLSVSYPVANACSTSQSLGGVTLTVTFGTGGGYTESNISTYGNSFSYSGVGSDSESGQSTTSNAASMGTGAFSAVYIGSLNVMAFGVVAHDSESGPGVFNISSPYSTVSTVNGSLFLAWQFTGFDATSQAIMPNSSAMNVGGGYAAQFGVLAYTTGFDLSCQDTMPVSNSYSALSTGPYFGGLFYYTIGMGTVGSISENSKSVYNNSLLYLVGDYVTGVGPLSPVWGVYANFSISNTAIMGQSSGYSTVATGGQSHYATFPLPLTYQTLAGFLSGYPGSSTYPLSLSLTSYGGYMAALPGFNVYALIVYFNSAGVSSYSARGNLYSSFSPSVIANIILASKGLSRDAMTFPSISSASLTSTGNYSHQLGMASLGGSSFSGPGLFPSSLTYSVASAISLPIGGRYYYFTLPFATASDFEMPFVQKHFDVNFIFAVRGLIIGRTPWYALPNLFRMLPMPKENRTLSIY